MGDWTLFSLRFWVFWSPSPCHQHSSLTQLNRWEAFKIWFVCWPLPPWVHVWLRRAPGIFPSLWNACTLSLTSRAEITKIQSKQQLDVTQTSKHKENLRKCQESCLCTTFNVSWFHPWLKWSESEQSPANLYLPPEYINSFLINDFIPGELCFKNVCLGQLLKQLVLTADEGVGEEQRSVLGAQEGGRRVYRSKDPSSPSPPSTEQPTCLVHLGCPRAPGDRTGLGKWHLHGVKREI